MTITTTGGVALNDGVVDAQIGELLKVYETGPNGYFAIKSALKNADSVAFGQDPGGTNLEDFLFHDGIDSSFTTVDGVTGIDGIVVRAIPGNSALALLLGEDSDPVHTTSYAISVADDLSLTYDHVAGWDTGDFADAFNDPLGFDDGLSPVNMDGTTMAIVLDAEGVLGTIYNDLMIGGTGNDLFMGAEGHDTLLGNAGNDVLRGGFGNDTIAGGDGSDTIRGGVGDDLLRGGDQFGSFGPSAADADSDRFVFLGVHNGDDRVADYGLGSDRWAIDMGSAGEVSLTAAIGADMDNDGNGDLLVIIDNFIGITGSILFAGIDTETEIDTVLNSVEVWGDQSRYHDDLLVNPLTPIA